MNFALPSSADRALAKRAATFGLCAAFLSSPGQTFFIGLFGGSLRAQFDLAEGAFGAIYGAALLPLAVTAALGIIDWRWLWVAVGAFILGVAMPLMRMLATPLPGQVLRCRWPLPHAFVANMRAEPQARLLAPSPRAGRHFPPVSFNSATTCSRCFSRGDG